MGANTFGKIFQLHTFGESHGAALGAVIDGCPAGVTFDPQLLQSDLDSRKPGTSTLVSSRSEPDTAEILSGVFEGQTLGTPIAVLVRNSDVRSQDYAEIKNTPRAGHADDVWLEKFGHRDHRGGGRSSGRETLSRVIGGSVAKMFLKSASPELRVRGWVSQLGPHSLKVEERNAFIESGRSAQAMPLRFPSNQIEQIQRDLSDLKDQGNSWGGVVELLIERPPKSLGQPVFHKLKSDLTQAFMSVGAVSAVELGQGLHQMDGSGVEFHRSLGSQVYGGIRGGISTGENISLKIHVKPTSSILDVAKRGRHDPAVLIRAVPVLEAMAALVLADHLLWHRLDRS